MELFKCMLNNERFYCVVLQYSGVYFTMDEEEKHGVYFKGNYDTAYLEILDV